MDLRHCKLVGYSDDHHSAMGTFWEQEGVTKAEIAGYEKSFFVFRELCDRFIWRAAEPDIAHVPRFAKLLEQFFRRVWEVGVDEKLHTLAGFKGLTRSPITNEEA